MPRYFEIIIYTGELKICFCTRSMVYKNIICAVSVYRLSYIEELAAQSQMGRAVFLFA